MGFSSLTRDWTRASCAGSLVSQPLDHQGSVRESVLFEAAGGGDTTALSPVNTRERNGWTKQRNRAADEPMPICPSCTWRGKSDSSQSVAQWMEQPALSQGAHCPPKRPCRVMAQSESQELLNWGLIPSSASYSDSGWLNLDSWLPHPSKGARDPFVLAIPSAWTTLPLDSHTAPFPTCLTVHLLRDISWPF